jgi:hypothetical protein
MSNIFGENHEINLTKSARKFVFIGTVIALAIGKEALMRS